MPNVTQRLVCVYKGGGKKKLGERERERGLMGRCHCHCGSMSSDQYSIRQNWASISSPSRFFFFFFFVFLLVALALQRASLTAENMNWNQQGKSLTQWKVTFLKQLLSFSWSSKIKEIPAASSGLTWKPQWCSHFLMRRRSKKCRTSIQLRPIVMLSWTSLHIFEVGRRQVGEPTPLWMSSAQSGSKQMWHHKGLIWKHFFSLTWVTHG